MRNSDDVPPGKLVIAIGGLQDRKNRLRQRPSDQRGRGSRDDLESIQMQDMSSGAKGSSYEPGYPQRDRESSRRSLMREPSSFERQSEELRQSRNSSRASYGRKHDSFERSEESIHSGTPGGPEFYHTNGPYSNPNVIFRQPIVYHTRIPMFTMEQHYNNPPPHQVIDRMPYQTTPVMPDQPQQKDVSTPTFVVIFIQRLFSVLFIIISLYLDWCQELGVSADPPAWVEGLNRIGNRKERISLECVAETKTAAAFYRLFCILGTMYALFQIVNLVGETLMEYQMQKQGSTNQATDEPPTSRITMSNGNATEVPYAENNAKQPETAHEVIIRSFVDRVKEMFTKGFQIIHGWNETVFGVVCEDIPQMIIVLFLSLKCSPNPGDIGVKLIWFLFKRLKNDFRFASCKQVYKPCCRYRNICEDCCVYSCNFFCVCKIFYCRCCPKGQEQCCELEDYSICPDCSCSTCERAGQCCGPIIQDPTCAKGTYETLILLEFFLYILIVVAQILPFFKIFLLYT